MLTSTRQRTRERRNRNDAATSAAPAHRVQHRPLHAAIGCSVGPARCNADNGSPAPGTPSGKVCAQYDLMLGAPPVFVFHDPAGELDIEDDHARAWTEAPEVLAARHRVEPAAAFGIRSNVLPPALAHRIGHGAVRLGQLALVQRREPDDAIDAPRARRPSSPRSVRCPVGSPCTRGLVRGLGLFNWSGLLSGQREGIRTPIGDRDVVCSSRLADVAHESPQTLDRYIR